MATNTMAPLFKRHVYYSKFFCGSQVFFENNLDLVGIKRNIDQRLDNYSKICYNERTLMK
jgi:hypothetical protein